MARPTKFSQETADKICDIIATSNRGLANICTELNISPSSVFNWIKEHSKFLESYARAREAQADFLADEIVEIADDSSRDVITINKNGQMVETENTEFVNRSKLRVDARKWKASKLQPKKYGDKLDVTSGNEPIKKQVFKIGDQIIEI